MGKSRSEMKMSFPLRSIFARAECAYERRPETKSRDIIATVCVNSKDGRQENEPIKQV
jgi:hypothetical protein